MQIEATGKYFEVPLIKNITCAYCGEKTINYKKFDKELATADKNNNLDIFVKKYNGIVPESERMKNIPLNDAAKIIRNHFRRFFATAEHILPESEGGKYEIGNLLSACNKCNSERKSEDFSSFIEKKPEVKQNIKAQIEFLKTTIPKAIKDKKLSPYYKDYIEKVTKTIYEQSQGKLDIKI